MIAGPVLVPSGRRLDSGRHFRQAAPRIVLLRLEQVSPEIWDFIGALTHEAKRVPQMVQGEPDLAANLAKNGFNWRTL